MRVSNWDLTSWFRLRENLNQSGGSRRIKLNTSGGRELSGLMIVELEAIKLRHKWIQSFATHRQFFADPTSVRTGVRAAEDVCLVCVSHAKRGCCIRNDQRDHDTNISEHSARSVDHCQQMVSMLLNLTKQAGKSKVRYAQMPQG